MVMRYAPPKPQGVWKNGRFWPTTGLTRGECEDHWFPDSHIGGAWESEVYPSRYRPQPPPALHGFAGPQFAFPATDPGIQRKGGVYLMPAGLPRGRDHYSPNAEIGGAWAPTLHGYEVSIPPSDRVFNFMAGNPNPYFITKTYGPAAPWPVNREATWITKQYGPASQSPVYRKDAAILIPAPGCPAFSHLSVVSDVYDGDLGPPDHLDAPLVLPPPSGSPLLGGWASDQIEAAKRFSDKYPAMLAVFYIGGILVLLKAMSIAKG